MTVHDERRSRSGAIHEPPVRTPPRTPRAPSRVAGYGWWILSIVVVVAAVLALAVIFAPEDAGPAFEAEWMPEYDVDTPLVVYTPPVAAFYVGEYVDFDPDMPAWMQSEYELDTAAVEYAPPTAAFTVGEYVDFDPDMPAWMQSEYALDTTRVIYGETFPRPGHYLGVSGDIASDR